MNRIYGTYHYWDKQGSNYGSATTQYFDRSTLFMDRLNAGNVEKLTVSDGRPFQMFMTRSEKNSDLAVQ